jgi:integrase/recombinase XerD
MPFFVAPHGGHYDSSTFYRWFRELLWETGVPYRGRLRGPRVHDLRHTFAVHCLERWYREGCDLNVKLPLLMFYMGHKTLGATQRYLRLTPEIFPDINCRLENYTGNIIPTPRREK